MCISWRWAWNFTDQAQRVYPNFWIVCCKYWEGVRCLTLNEWDQRSINWRTILVVEVIIEWKKSVWWNTSTKCDRHCWITNIVVLIWNFWSRYCHRRCQQYVDSWCTCWDYLMADKRPCYCEWMAPSIGRITS